MKNIFFLLFVVFISTVMADIELDLYGRTIGENNINGTKTGWACGFYWDWRADWGSFSETRKLEPNKFILGWEDEGYVGAGSIGTPGNKKFVLDFVSAIPAGLTGRYNIGGGNEFGFLYIPLQITAFIPSVAGGTRLALTYEGHGFKAGISRVSEGFFIGVFLPLPSSYEVSIRYNVFSKYSISALYGFGDCFEGGTGNTIGIQAGLRY